MKVQIQSLHFHAREDLKQYVQKKLSKLEQYSDKLLHAEVYLKIDDTNPKANKVAEVELFLPGPPIFSHAISGKFETAMNTVYQQLKKQLIKRKEKLSSRR
ncbi:MAG: ribosome-associated translation inhibitor RaiA [Bacteroidota bacterium]